MPTAQPRLNVVLEKPLMAMVETLAERDGMSMSQKARDLIRDAIEIDEDAALEALVASRMKNKAPSIPASRFWAERAKRRAKR